MAGTIYDLLTRDHEEFKRMLSQLSKGEEGFFERLRTEFTGHSQAEETILYKRLETHEKTKDIVEGNYKEHKRAAQIMDELGEHTGQTVRFRVIAKLLQEAMEHHIKDEEADLFPEAREILSPDEAERMGLEFEEEKQRLIGERRSAPTVT